MARPSRRLWLPWLAMGIVLAVALAIGVQPRHEPTLAERVRSVSETIKCPQCTAESVASSDAPASVAARDEITKQLEAGRSPDEVRDWFSDRYGPGILLTPRSSGVDSLVWILPVVAVVFAVAGLAFAFWRWRGRTTDRLSREDADRVERALAARR